MASSASAAPRSAVAVADQGAEQRRGLASVIQLLEPQSLLPKSESPSSVGRKVGRVEPEAGIAG